MLDMRERERERSAVFGIGYAGAGERKVGGFWYRL